jgi:hypothetical protein
MVELTLHILLHKCTTLDSLVMVATQVTCPIPPYMSRRPHGGLRCTICQMFGPPSCHAFVSIRVGSDTICKTLWFKPGWAHSHGRSTPHTHQANCIFILAPCKRVSLMLVVLDNLNSYVAQPLTRLVRCDKFLTPSCTQALRATMSLISID